MIKTIDQTTIVKHLLEIRSLSAGKVSVVIEFRISNASNFGKDIDLIDEGSTVDLGYQTLSKVLSLDIDLNKDAWTNVLNIISSELFSYTKEFIQKAL